MDGCNIWVVERTKNLGPERDNQLLDPSYAIVLPSYDMSYALSFLTGFYGLDFMADIDINPSSMGLIFRCVERTDSSSPEKDRPPLDHSYLVVVPSYDVSRALILLTGL